MGKQPLKKKTPWKRGVFLYVPIGIFWTLFVFTTDELMPRIETFKKFFAADYLSFLFPADPARATRLTIFFDRADEKNPSRPVEKQLISVNVLGFQRDTNVSGKVIFEKLDKMDTERREAVLYGRSVGDQLSLWYYSSQPTRPFWASADLTRTIREDGDFFVGTIFMRTCAEPNPNNPSECLRIGSVICPVLLHFKDIDPGMLRAVGNRECVNSGLNDLRQTN